MSCFSSSELVLGLLLTSADMAVTEEGGKGTKKGRRGEGTWRARSVVVTRLYKANALMSLSVQGPVRNINRDETRETSGGEV